MSDTLLSGAIVGLETAGAAVIVLTAGAAAILIAANLARYRQVSWEAARRTLGRGLVLGLDFLIGADILKSMVAPTLGEVEVLAAIVILRTILSLTIEFELREMVRAPEGDDLAGPGQR